MPPGVEPVGVPVPVPGGVPVVVVPVVVVGVPVPVPVVVVVTGVAEWVVVLTGLTWLPIAPAAPLSI